MKDDINFLYEMGTLRLIDRTWRQFLKPDFANLAEHTLRVMWIALVIAKHENIINTEKVLKMALVHDISESRTGDVQYLSRQYTKRDEHKAIKDILQDTALEKEFVQLWEEYEKRECIEANIVKDADNIDVDMELKEQEVRGHEIGKKWKGMRSLIASTKLYTETAKRFYKSIQDSDPHDWHVNSQANRINGGDWKDANLKNQIPNFKDQTTK